MRPFQKNDTKIILKSFKIKSSSFKHSNGINPVSKNDSMKTLTWNAKFHYGQPFDFFDNINITLKKFVEIFGKLTIEKWKFGW